MKSLYLLQSKKTGTTRGGAGCRQNNCMDVGTKARPAAVHSKVSHTTGESRSFTAQTKRVYKRFGRREKQHQSEKGGGRRDTSLRDQHGGGIRGTSKRGVPGLRSQETYSVCLRAKGRGVKERCEGISREQKSVASNSKGQEGCQMYSFHR